MTEPLGPSTNKPSSPKGSDWLSRFCQAKDEAPELPADAAAATRFLLNGNARFIAAVAPNITAPSTANSADGFAPAAIHAKVPKQAPMCIVLGCADARVPAELVFDAKPNQLFVVRVAGNVLGDECLGSIEYAVANFADTAHLLVVLGHTGCGAVSAAVQSYLDPKMQNSIAFTRSLRSVVSHIFIPVHSAALALAEAWGADVTTDPGYKSALTEASIYLNAGMTAYQALAEIRGDQVSGLEVVFAVYDVATSRVIGPDLDPATDDTSKLAAAPANPEGLQALGRHIATSQVVARYLSPSRKPTPAES